MTVWLPLLKGGKREALVRPLTELGVARIVPRQTRHAVVRLEAKRADERVARLVSLAAESANQCGLRIISKVSPVVTELPPRDRLKATGAPAVFFWEAGGRDSFEIQAYLSESPTVPVLCGPEGGLASEAEQLAADGWEAFSLGPRILRAETAVVAGTTLVVAALGGL